MALGLLGHKIGMTRIFDNNGDVIPVTVIKAGPCFVTQIKTVETDGYNAVQLGYLELSSKQVKKPQAGHFIKSGVQPLRYIREYKVEDTNQFELGQQLDTDLFDVGQTVQITGKSIGKGFAGNHKRHKFSRGPMTHGSKNHRAPGSIGAGTTPGRVLVGKKMAGQLGNSLTTVSNVKIVKIDSTNNLLVVRGSIPGKAKNLISVK